MKPRLVVNGRARELGEVGGHVTLLEWLRGERAHRLQGGLRGRRVRGVRRAGRPRPDGPDRTRWVAINACLVPAAAFDQQEVVTAEGLGRPGQLHPVQREMADRGGSQCGYCTPGLHLLDGRRVLPARARSRAPDRARQRLAAGPNGQGRVRQRDAGLNGQGSPHGRTANGAGTSGAGDELSTGRTGSTCTRSAATCAGAPGTGRSATPLTPSASRRRTTRSWPGWPSRRRRPAATTTSSAQGRYVRPPSLARGARTAGRQSGRAAGGRVDRLGRRAEHPARPGRADHRHRPDRGAARVLGRPRPRSTSAPR